MKVMWLLLCVMAPLGVHGGLLDSIREHKTQKTRQRSQETISDVVNSNNGLGISMLKALGDQNVLLSPISVNIVLHMVLMGARGRTAYQMSAQMGNPSSALMSELLQKMSSPGGNSRNVALDHASAVLIQEGAPFNASYYREINRLFDASLATVQFGEGRGSDVVKEVNEWASKKTRGRIPQFLEEAPEETTKMLVLNAMYFKSDWKTQFDPEFTDKRVFRNEDGTTANVPIMFIIETFDFSHDDELNVDALRVPYADNQYSMILMLPRNRQSPLASVVQGLTAAKLNEIIGEMEPEQVELSLPKMSVQKMLKLRAPLEKLGLRVPFTDAADFKGISKAEDLRLNEILHKAALDVDEVGTRAVAATQAQFVSKSLVHFKQFTVDRPFLALIRHEPTGAVLFIAQVLSMQS
ncbi:leukocyte elastase inhibitor [Rhipicephalus sanguineus]|uniref:leukocyte elastase inhibitor n=1 Tax=Rhipicephalus sanguineus TaxID=34632 RepID=UPI001895F4AD|nr:leukocyte elastase inhibitor [Rhipicephalus sanguineus]